MDNKAEKSNVGYTLFKSTGVHHEFTHIDLEKQQSNRYCYIQRKNLYDRFG